MRGNNTVHVQLTSNAEQPRIPSGLKVCLVSAPTATDFDSPDLAESDQIRLLAEHAPLGILSLAAVLENSGISAEIVDLNDWYYQYLRSEKTAPDFCGFASERLQKLTFDVIGFSTICSSYPLTLRIAERVKSAYPSCTAILGGPQASVVDCSTMETFSFIDCVIRGEAERTLLPVLAALASREGLGLIPGITYRNGTDICRNPNAPAIENLDSLPMPAFHLCPHLKASRYIPLELGRGCPFACTFCSTNDFFRRNFRLKSPAIMIAQMRAIRDTYQISTFDLIHDMFTVDRKRVIAFCEALLATEEAFYWNCSARTDCIDEELIELMESAGCRGIFFGIETGSQRLQHIINKRLNLEQAMKMIECNNAHHIRTAVSLISGFPDEIRDDLRGTVSFFIDSLRYDYAEPQFHILAPLAETPIEHQYRDRLVFDNIISDMSYQGWRQEPPDLDLIRAHADIFSNFYSVPTPGLDRQHLKELRDFLLNGAVRFRWLLVALQQEVGDFIEIFDQWRVWHQSHNRPAATQTAFQPYYSSTEFRTDFLQFVSEELITALTENKAAIEAILEYESIVHCHAENSNSYKELSSATPVAQPMKSDSIPVTSRLVTLKQMNRDYRSIIEHLRHRKCIGNMTESKVTLAIRPRPSGRVDIVQLSDLSAEIAMMCNGTRTVKSISEEMCDRWQNIDGVPADKACLFGLEMLRMDGVIDYL